LNNSKLTVTLILPVTVEHQTDSEEGWTSTPSIYPNHEQHFTKETLYIYGVCAR